MANLTSLISSVDGWPQFGDEGPSALTDHAMHLMSPGVWNEEAIMRLPSTLRATWLASWVELEILNGGYFQYFWNDAADVALQTAADFDLIGAAGYATVQRSAIAAFQPVAAEINRLRAEGITAYQAAMKLEDFNAQDEAFMSLYEQAPVSSLLSRWLFAHKPDVIADLLKTQEWP